MDEMSDPNTGLGYAVILLVILPFWLVYFLALFFTKGRARSLIALFGLTLVSSCSTWIGTSLYSIRETAEHGFSADWSHRPHLWLTLLMSALLIISVAAPWRIWTWRDEAGRLKASFIALPALGAYLAYIWAVVGEYGFTVFFLP